MLVVVLCVVLFSTCSELLLVIVAGAVIEAFVRLHEKGLIYQGAWLI